MHREAVKEAKFNDDDTLIKESIVYKPEIEMGEMLEAIVEKKPVVVRERFHSLMKILTERIIDDFRNEVAKTAFKKDFLDKNSKEIPNG
jgi:hypothetical protein